MRVGRRLDGLFEDLEQQAEASTLAERDAEVAEEVAGRSSPSVDLAGRLHASRGARLGVTLQGVGVVEGRLVRAGADWCLLDVAGVEWIVPLAAVVSLRGLSARSADPAARPLGAAAGAGLGVAGRRGHPGRGLLLDRAGGASRCRVERVGADFVEVAQDSTRPRGAPGPGTVPLAALAAVRTR